MQTSSRCVRVLAGLALLAVFAGPATAQQPIELKVGISDRVNTVLPLWMAQAGGFFAAQGLKVEIVNMGGGSRGARELAAGRLDAMRVGLSSVVQANRAGGDLRLIASMSNVIRFTFFSAAGVRSAADLKGGVVGVSTFGSESDSTVTLALERLGLSRNDIVVKEYGGSTRRLAALKSGEIKATAINEPTASQARAEGVNVLVDLVAEQIPWLFSGLVVRRGDLSARRDLATRLLKAAIEGNYVALADERRGKAVLAKELRLADEAIIAISYDDFRRQSPRDMEPSRKGAENVLAQLPGGSARLDDYIDTGILDDLRKEGFFTAMVQKYKVK